MSVDYKIFFTGQVDDEGKLKITDRKGFDTQLLAFKGKRVMGEIGRLRKIANERQRGYLWAVVYKYAAKGFQDAGYQAFSENDCHAYFKDKFKPGREIPDPVTGEMVTLITTEGITKFVKATYVDQIRQFCAEFLNTNIPDPDPFWKENEEIE